MPAARLFTLGYEGADIAAFIATLRAARIATVLDVREAPFSRKPDFRKAALEAHLADAGIGYRHLHGLGNPKPGRDAAKAGDRERYQRIFHAHMATPEAQKDLRRAADITIDTAACLICLEADATHCHRAIVAEQLSALTGQPIEHLRLDGQRDLGF